MYAGGIVFYLCIMNAYNYIYEKLHMNYKTLFAVITIFG